MPNISPFQLVFKKEPTFKYIRQFGAKVKYLDTYYKTKLQPRSLEGIFVGYTVDDFIYKVFDPESGRIFRSRDISFDPTINPKISQVSLKEIEEKRNKILEKENEDKLVKEEKEVIFEINPISS